jgi:hypothetical protein
MTEVNNKVYTVHAPATNTFQLRDKTDTATITSAAFTAYISGGQVERVENTFTTLGHLEGQTVSIIADGGYYGTKTVTAGTITLDDYYNVVHAGLNYMAKLLPERLEIAGQGTEGRIKRITSITLRFYKTLACAAGASWNSYENVVFRDADTPLEQATALFTGDKQLPFTGDYETAGNIYIQDRLPMPCTVLCVIPEWEIGN